jgi:glyoxylase-like metal-dependent hydrolase (beta-lactamase superfamily II)
MKHVIYPILTARIATDQSTQTYFAGFGNEIIMPCVGWYIDADGVDILIDSGADEATINKYWHGGEDVQTLEEALAKHDKRPADIDYVIQTHLHFDHCGNTHLCHNAKVIVQEEELKFAFATHPLFAAIYPNELYVGLNFQVINGEKELFPGIRVIPAPGHTPGTQAVALETEKGLAVITGFCCIKENFQVPDEMKPLWPFFTPGIHTDALQAYWSALKITGMADILIPSHEMEFATMDKIPG